MAHDSYMFSAGTSHLNTFFVSDFSYRFVMHDKLDPSPGFLKNSAIEALSLQMSLKESNIWLKILDIINLENILPLNTFAPQFS